ncbi:hypothetical protein AAG906_035639 [Vitis piasezkii]
MDDAIVLYPGPGIGHVVSMIELGKLILRRYSHRFSIIILLSTGPFDTPATTSYIDHISQTNPSISFHRFPYLSVDTSSSTCNIVAVFSEFFRLSASNVLHALQQLSKTSTVRAFIIDYFCASALPVACDLEFHLPLPHHRCCSTRVLEPWLNRDDPAYIDMLYFSELLPKSDGLLINTFHDLEPIAVKTIREGTCVPNGQTPPVYCIGPLIADTGEDESNIAGSVARHGCLSWLDTQPSQSVVFLCFGSNGTFSPAQVKEIANGLERSGKRFLWVVKNPPSNDKSKQIAVTADAVVAGVPMVAWPLYAEQHMNKAALVEVMKMAIGVEQRDEDMFVSGAEVERRVRELMECEEGRELRERSRKTREMALAAWKDGVHPPLPLPNWLMSGVKIDWNVSESSLLLSF